MKRPQLSNSPKEAGNHLVDNYTHICGSYERTTRTLNPSNIIALYSEGVDVWGWIHVLQLTNILEGALYDYWFWNWKRMSTNECHSQT